MTNYFSSSRHTNYPLISQTMNGNVLGFRVGFRVTLTHCIRLKMWVFNQSIFYFSVCLCKPRPAPICCWVNYRTIKTCLNYRSRLKSLFTHTAQRRCESCDYTNPEKIIFLFFYFFLKQHYFKSIFIVKAQHCPLAASDLCLIYSCSQFPFKHLCCTATQRPKYIFYYLIEQNTCRGTWELAL